MAICILNAACHNSMKNSPYPLNKLNFKTSNFNELLCLCLKHYEDRIAFRYRENNELRHISFQQFAADAAALGKYFIGKGLNKAKISIIGENSYSWMLTYFAALSSGNIIVPIDNQLPDGDIFNLLDNSDASVLVFSDDYSDILPHIQEKSEKINEYINMKTDMPKLINNKGQLSFDDPYFKDIKINKHDVAAIVYTSGTTGTQKGVMLSHRNILSDAISGCRFMDISYEETLVMLPFHHTLSSTPGVVAQLMGGTAVSICASAKNISRDFADFKPKYTIMVPLIVEMMYKKIWETAKEQGKDDLLKKILKVSNFLLKLKIDLRRKLFKSVLSGFGGNLEWVLCGGAAISIEYIQGFRDFGIEILQAYGVTECSPGVSLNRNRYMRDGSVGVILDCNQVKISEPDDKGIGEIFVKGKNVMLGYYNDEESTKDAFDHEWFKTGDLGYLDDDGFLYITGRKKNLIVLSSGKNVSPEELELKVLSIPAVLEALVYQEGDRIITEVFLDKDKHSEWEKEFKKGIHKLNTELPQYKQISHTIIRDTEFPKTTTKKIKRK